MRVQTNQNRESTNNTPSTLPKLWNRAVENLQELKKIKGTSLISCLLSFVPEEHRAL